MPEPRTRTQQDTKPTTPFQPRLRFKVLASGSKGNASILITLAHDQNGRPSRHITLIDCGLTPKALNRALKDAGLTIKDIDDVLLTHLDRDHAHHAALLNDKLKAPLRIHRRHLNRAEREGVLRKRTIPFDDDPFPLNPSLHAAPLLLDHDHLGVAAFRFDCPPLNRALGFATDLGRPTDALYTHMARVDCLAIEANYCPELQHASNRPAFLKRRIMNGAGHLSNDQCAEATRRIRPTEHVVLLHRSQQCNTTERAAAPHAGATYTLTHAHQDQPTPWIELRARPTTSRPTTLTARASVVIRQPLLFDIPA